MPATDAERETPAKHRQPFSIRTAQNEDLEPIVSVLLTSFYDQAKATQWLYWILRIGIQEDIKVKIKSPADQYVCLVATTISSDVTQAERGVSTGTGRDRAAIIGTVEISQRPCATWQLFPPKRAYLANLAISPAHRREGAAHQLLVTCENIALKWGFRHVYLHVMADNAAAQALYKQAGYRPCEVSNPILSSIGLRPQRLLLSKQVQ